jgi:hypothetical protein
MKIELFTVAIIAVLVLVVSVTQGLSNILAAHESINLTKLCDQYLAMPVAQEKLIFDRNELVTCQISVILYCTYFYYRAMLKILVILRALIKGGVAFSISDLAREGLGRN